MVAFPDTFGETLILVLVTAIGTLTAIIPPSIFLVRGWPTKTKQIMNDFDPSTIKYYFSKYWVNETVRSSRATHRNAAHVSSSTKLSDLNDEDPGQRILLVTEMQRLYDEYFGRSLYILPIFILFVINLLGVAFSVRSGLYHTQPSPAASAAHAPPHIILDFTTIAGMSGAYLWVVGDGINRMRINDYLPSDIYGHILRLTVAIPLGLAFASLNTSFGPFLAFSVGTFPLDTISRFIRIIATKLAGVTGDTDTDGDEIKRIIGINNDVSHRLMAENIATVLALSKCDPIRVMMRTNLDLDVVLDIMDQAIVAVNFMTSDLGPSNRLIDTLRVSSLSRSSQISQLMRAAESGDNDAAALLQSLPTLLKLDGPQVMNLLNNIRSDDHTQLVCRLKFEVVK